MRADVPLPFGLTVEYYRQFARFGDQFALQPMSERVLRGGAG
jgi:hypothetical protein